MTADPILKIGAVVLRTDAPQVLILQPTPKHAGEVPPFVLPRGSRQYQDASGQWHDARDAETGRRYAATLEPYARALAREIEEEAGVTPAMLKAARVLPFGPLEFHSRKKGIYPIYWYVVQLDAQAARQLVDASLPAEALALRWAGIEEIREMATAGTFSAGYVPVIEQALALAKQAPLGPVRGKGSFGR